MIHRRDLFQTAVTIGAASVLARGSTQAEETGQSPSPAAVIVDTNVSLFHWPFRRLPLDQTDALVAHLRSLGVGQAWAGSFEGLLHRDITSVNARLAAACQQVPELFPIGSINPILPGWEDDLRTCVNEHKMRGIRLYPNYHGYTLAEPKFGKLLKLASAQGVLVQLCVAMEDTRTQHPLVRVADVDLTHLPDVIARHPNAKVQLLNYRPKRSEMAVLSNVRSLYFDTARVEGSDGVAALIDDASPGKVMFGTHSPFLIPEAALIRAGESRLNDETIRSLLFEVADNIIS